jgi:hypothetical protein
MWQKNYYATCHNFGSLLIIIINDGDQYVESKIIFMSKNLHSVKCQILIDRWQSMMLTWHHGYNYNGVA